MDENHFTSVKLNSFSWSRFAFRAIQFAGIAVVILLLVFRKQPKQIYNVAPVKEIERRIEGKETQIKTFETKIGNEKAIVSQIVGQIDELRVQLSQFKREKDTVNIIQIQDTMINYLTKENRHLYQVVNYQDSMILAQRYIINSKDTIIAVKDHDIKRIKRQRNASLLINGIQTVIILAK